MISGEWLICFIVTLRPGKTGLQLAIYRRIYNLLFYCYIVTFRCADGFAMRSRGSLLFLQIWELSLFHCFATLIVALLNGFAMHRKTMDYRPLTAEATEVLGSPGWTNYRFATTFHFSLLVFHLISSWLQTKKLWTINRRLWTNFLF